jgi:hypothetical protein
MGSEKKMISIFFKPIFPMEAEKAAKRQFFNTNFVIKTLIKGGANP